MKGQTKTAKYVGRVTRQIVAKNLRERLQARYGDKKNHARRFEEEFGVNFSTVQRILEEEVGASVDLLEEISIRLRISPYQLLVPPEEMRQMFEVKDPLPLVRQTDQSTESTRRLPKERRITR